MIPSYELSVWIELVTKAAVFKVQSFLLANCSQAELMDLHSERENRVRENTQKWGGGVDGGGAGGGGSGDGGWRNKYIQREEERKMCLQKQKHGQFIKDLESVFSFMNITL